MTNALVYLLNLLRSYFCDASSHLVRKGGLWNGFYQSF